MNLLDKINYLPENIYGKTMNSDLTDQLKKRFLQLNRFLRFLKNILILFLMQEDFLLLWILNNLKKKLQIKFKYQFTLSKKKSTFRGSTTRRT